MIWTFGLFLFLYFCFVLVRFSLSNLVLVFNLILDVQKCRLVVVDTFTFCIFFSFQLIFFFNLWGHGHCHWWLLNGQIVSMQCFVSLCLCTYHLGMQSKYFLGKKKFKNGSDHELAGSCWVGPQKMGQLWVGPFLIWAKKFRFGPS